MFNSPPPPRATPLSELQTKVLTILSRCTSTSCFSIASIERKLVNNMFCSSCEHSMQNQNGRSLFMFFCGFMYCIISMLRVRNKMSAILTEETEIDFRIVFHSDFLLTQVHSIYPLLIHMSSCLLENLHSFTFSII